MSHLQFAALESYVSPRDQNWEAWVNRVEELLGHDLDGDQVRDGYSMDFAHDAWLAEVAPEQYAAEVICAGAAPAPSSSTGPQEKLP